MLRGVAPSLLLEQVRNTASWALDGAATGWRSALLDAPAFAARLDAGGPSSPGRMAEHLRLMLAAHFATVGTFVPTDVDTRIRHHAWQEVEDPESLAALVAVVDEAARWDPREVSARVLSVPLADGAGQATLSGHDGEWLSVRAGALGRALALEAKGADVEATLEALVGAVDVELAREAHAFRVASGPGKTADPLHALRVATTLAHNLGDLSRVVEEWPCKSERARALQARFAKLGHVAADRHDGLFALAGQVNKAVMALENHRFLPLRRPRALRRARALLLPIGPFFDAWGATIARHPALELADRAEVLAALLDGHEQSPTQHGYLRAIAGLHHAHPGGVEAICAELPARARKRVAVGAVREAFGVTPERFEARMIGRYRAAAGPPRG